MGGEDTVGAGGERLIANRYRLSGVIGSGGAGTVWTAVDEVLGREVAVKDIVIPPWLDEAERELARERTLREARAACRIDHPNVVDIYDVVEQDDRPWIVMRLVKAPSLAQLTDRHGPRTPRAAARIGLQVLSALQAAHAHGIMHRDVKPSNVLVDDDRAVLTDFGIATIEGESTLTSPDTLVGAPSYIAPERVRGAPATPASDLWSLGATLYAAVEGRPPHLREGVIAILTAVATDEPDPPKRAGALTPLLTALLCRDPAQRPDAAQVELFLRRVVALTDEESDETDETAALASAAITTAINRAGNRSSGTGPQSTGPHGTGPGTDQPTATRPVPVIRSRRTPALAGAAAVAVLAVLLSGLFLQPSSLPGSPSQQQRPAEGGPTSQAPASSVQPEGQPAGAREATRPTSSAASSSVQPAAESSQLPPAQSTGQTPAEPAPTGSQPPVTTTQTPEPPPTTTEEPPASTAQASQTA